MARQLFTNNAQTQLASTVLGTFPSGATTLQVLPGTGSAFPTPTGGDYFLVTVFQKDLSGNETRMEIVKCTARTGDVLTVLRDAEPLVGVPGGGYDYPQAAGDVVYVQLRVTAAALGNGLQASAALSDLSNPAAARTNLGLTKYATWSDVKATTAAISPAAFQSVQLLYAGAITATLPGTPADGDLIEFKVMNGLATNVVNPNGKSINGTGGNMTINITAGSFALQYTTNTGDWRIV